LLLYTFTIQRSATEMAVGRHATTASSATSGAQAIDTVTEGDTGAATEYSSIGPSYETTQVSSNHSSRQQQERYEYSEPHVATRRGDGVGKGEAPMDYEVPLQSGEHAEYSHLQH
jgi:hypothetical protein